jgi:hypothetical protein
MHDTGYVCAAAEQGADARGLLFRVCCWCGAAAIAAAAKGLLLQEHAQGFQCGVLLHCAGRLAKAWQRREKSKGQICVSIEEAFPAAKSPMKTLLY